MTPDESKDYQRLVKRLDALSSEQGIDPNYIFYLSVPPSVYEPVSRNLSQTGLSRSDQWFRRLIVEKPFGVDLASAQKLNKDLLNYVEESQVYRIDHYLGKESVQNM